MSDRQTPESRLHALTDLHASIVRADGSVGGIDTRPIPGWQNHDGSAARGAQYRDDQPAGVDNSQQAAQGCRVAAGASGRRADTCPLGTADVSLHPVFIPRALFAKAARELGHDVAGLPSEGGQRYFDWVGGGIRYWEGHRMVPHGG